MSEALDIWSFGTVLFELCSGERLFVQNIADDEIVGARQETRKCVWNCISDEELDPVFMKLAASSSKELRELIGHAK